MLIKEKLYECAKRVIDSGIYINGTECEAFANELSGKLNLGNVVPVSNGLDAIRLIIRGYIEMGLLRKGDEIIVPANTYIATVLPLVEFGLTPRLVQPDLTTYGLDWLAAEEAVNSKTRALITVHLYGTPSWNFEIAKGLESRGILLIEDNAQAIGASITDNITGKEQFTGSLGDAAAFSFYPTKNLGALGDAGVVTTKDKDLARVVKALANYGSTRRYYNEYIGFNCRMDEMQAAFLRLKLQFMENESAEREKKALLYHTLIKNPEIVLPSRLPEVKQVWHQYVIRSSRRDELVGYLDEKGVKTDIHYPLSLYNQPCFFKGDNVLGHDENTYKITQKIASEVLSLPIANVTDNEIEEIADLINKF